MEKQILNKLKQGASRSDDLLSSYSCRKFEKCSFEKDAFEDKSTYFIVINFLISYLGTPPLLVPSPDEKGGGGTQTAT